MLAGDPGQEAEWQAGSAAGTRSCRPESQQAPEESALGQSSTTYTPIASLSPGSLALWHRIKTARFSFLRCVRCMRVRVHPLVCEHVRASDMLLHQSYVSSINPHLIF